MQRAFERVRVPLVVVLGVIAVFWKLALTRQYTFADNPDIAEQVVPWLNAEVFAIRHGSGQREVFSGQSGLKVYENPGAFPRAWTVPPIQPHGLREHACAVGLDGFDSIPIAEVDLQIFAVHFDALGIRLASQEQSHIAGFFQLVG